MYITKYESETKVIWLIRGLKYTNHNRHVYLNENNGLHCFHLQFPPNLQLMSLQPHNDKDILNTNCLSLLQVNDGFWTSVFWSYLPKQIEVDKDDIE